MVEAAEQHVPRTGAREVPEVNLEMALEPDLVFSKPSISVHGNSGDDDVVACQRIVPLVFLEPRGW